MSVLSECASYMEESLVSINVHDESRVVSVSQKMYLFFENFEAICRRRMNEF